MLVIATPDLAHEVLRAPPGTYLAGVANSRILPVLPQDTVLTLDGAEHRRRRRLVAPMFHGDALDAIAPVVGDLAAREADRWPVGKPFATLPYTRRLALSVAARVILGIDDEISVRQLQRHLARALRPYSMLSGNHGMTRLGTLSPGASGDRGRRAFARGLMNLGSSRRGPAGPACSGQDPTLAGGGLPADEIFALLLAAHETMATALAWTITLLSRTPHAADGVLRESGGPSRPWLDSVIWEVLRLRPPLIDIPRQAARDVRLAGRAVSPGTLLLIPPPLIHHNAGLDDPERFAPERFASGRPDPQTWLPFGGGDRRCLGASLAMLVLRESLTEILKRFVVTPARPTAERPVLYGTALIPARGGRVVLHRRAPHEAGQSDP